jgi:hypothetical protein
MANTKKKSSERNLNEDNLDEIINVREIEEAGGKLVLSDESLEAIFPADTSPLVLARAAVWMTLLSSELFIVAPEINRFNSEGRYWITHTRAAAEDALVGVL